MKKNITTALAGALAVFLLAKLGFFDALMMFVLVGAIPGTTYSLPASFMLLISLTAMWFLLFHWAALKTLHTRATSKFKGRQHKKQLPKRRYGEI